MLQPAQHDPYRHEERPSGELVRDNHRAPEGQMVIPYQHPSTTPDWRMARMGNLETVEAPEGYYRQDGHAQLALPGMEMSPQEHVEALGRHLGMKASIYTYRPSRPGSSGSIHQLSLGDGSSSFLDWSGREGSTDTLGFENRLQPGEISMVSGAEKGHAAAMHATARRLAAEHPQEYSMPRHSETLTVYGRPWAAKESRKYGEHPWMEQRG